METVLITIPIENRQVSVSNPNECSGLAEFAFETKGIMRYRYELPVGELE